jgi:Arc/MetJ family transcription regulator
MCNLMCEEQAVATNLAIDPDLLERAQRVGGERTKKATVTRALEEYIARREQRLILQLAGTLDWDPTFDYKEARRSRDRKLGLTD